MTKAIIFDFWGTLVENGINSPIKEAGYILRVRMPFSEFVVRFEKSFMIGKFKSLTEAFENVANEFQLKLPGFVIEKLVGMWNKNAILAKPYDETIEVLEELKKEGYKLILISNTDEFSVENAIEKYDLKEYFDEIFLSYQIGQLKQDFLKEIANRINMNKEDLVMVGDSMETDVKGAIEAGIKAILVDRRNKREYENKISNLRELKEKL